MSQKLSLSVPRGPVYLTHRLAESGSYLLIQNIDLLRRAVSLTKAELPFEIVTWVVLPDHMHCVWKLPEGDVDFAARWRLIKTRFSKGFFRRSATSNAVITDEAPIWQKQFYQHEISSQVELNAYVQHCWMNPVKHQLVKKPDDWLFSSIHRDMRERRFERVLAS